MFARLAHNSDFQKVYQSGACIRERLFNLFYCPNESGRSRLGVLASKKTGPAVIRNRAKRLLREGFRLLKPEYSQGFDIVLSAKSAMIGRKLPEIKEALKNALAKLPGLLKNESTSNLAD
jgi:ribonuclease P protein component